MNEKLPETGLDVRVNKLASLPLIRLEKADALKWFAKDAPGWRFAALVVLKLPAIVIAAILAFMQFK